MAAPRVLRYDDSHAAFVLTTADHKLVEQTMKDGWARDTAYRGSGTALFTREPYAAVHHIKAAQDDLTRNRLIHLANEYATSLAEDAPDIYPAPPGMTPLPFQNAGIRYALSRPNPLIGDEMGLCKTSTSILMANEMQAQRMLVVCPASVRLQWQKEVRAWSTIKKLWTYPILKSADGVSPVAHWTFISYDLLRHPHIRAALDKLRFDMLVLDECFPYETLVETEFGSFPIGQIVRERLPVRVWGRNTVGDLDLMRITRYIKTTSEEIIRIKHEQGVLECTPNHEIYLHGSAIPISAKDLQPGQVLRMVSDWLPSQAENPAFLQPELFGPTAHRGFPRINGAQYGCDVGQSIPRPPTGRSGEDAAPQFRSGISRQSGRRCEVAERAELAWEEGRERAIDQTPDSRCDGPRLANGAYYPNGPGEGSIQEFAAMLQSGPCTSGDKVGGGNRRAEPSNKTVAIFGRPENGSASGSRVESVEVYKPRGPGGLAVYNLEVEGGHNYFANRVNVGNCHYLKTSDSKRTRATFGDLAGTIEGVSSRAEKIVGLTGTPLPNRPRECYMLARHMCWDAIDWLSEEAFERRFNPSMKLWTGKVLEEVGRMPELRARLRCNFMVRRLKKKVLTQLPEQQYELTYIEPNGEIRKVLKAESMLHIDVERLEDMDMATRGHIATVRREMGVAKIPRIVEHISMLLDGGLPKVVVAAYHKEVMAALAGKFARFGCATITGGQSPMAREREKARFIQDPRCRVILGQLLAAGEGVDGLQRVCSHGVFAEADWTPKTNDQFAARLWRMGQSRGVLWQFLVAPGSLDERILGRAIGKAHNIHKTLDGE